MQNVQLVTSSRKATHDGGPVDIGGGIDFRTETTFMMLKMYFNIFSRVLHIPGGCLGCLKHQPRNLGKMNPF